MKVELYEINVNLIVVFFVNFFINFVDFVDSLLNK